MALKGNLKTKGTGNWFLILVPFIVRIGCVVIKVYLFPDNCFCVLCGHGVVDCCPYIIPVNFTPKIFLPLTAMMMFFVSEFDQSIIYKLMGYRPEYNMLVFYGVIESIVNPVIDILILNLEKYPGYAFPMRLFILLLFVLSKYLPICEYGVTFTCGVDSEGVVASILKCWIVSMIPSL